MRKPRNRYLVVELFQVTSFENKGGVLHCGLAISMKKYVKARQRIMETFKYFRMQK